MSETFRTNHCWQALSNTTRKEQYYVQTRAFDKLSAEVCGETSMKVIVLSGVAGSGKTSLANALMRKHGLDSKGGAYFRVQCDNKKKMTEDICQFANRVLEANCFEKKIGTESDAHVIFKQHLHTQCPWMILFDNLHWEEEGVGDILEDMLDTLEECGHGTVLITTQDSTYNIERSLDIPSIYANLEDEAYRLSPNEATILFSKVFKKQLLTDLDGFNELNDLMEELGFLPLGIIIAAAYLRESNVSLPYYLNALKDMYNVEDKIKRYVRQSIMQRSAIKLSIAKLGDFRNGKYLTLMLQFCATLDSDDISRELLVEFHKELHERQYSVGDFYRDSQKYCLLRMHQHGDAYTMHREVQRAALECIENSVKVQLIKAATNTFANILLEQDSENCQIILHIASFLNYYRNICLVSENKEVVNEKSETNIKVAVVEEKACVANVTCGSITTVGQQYNAPVTIINNCLTSNHVQQAGEQQQTGGIDQDTIDQIEKLQHKVKWQLQAQIIGNDETNNSKSKKKLFDAQSKLRDIVREDYKFFQAPLKIDNFVGRQNEKNQLWQHLRPNSDIQHRWTVVVGLGGMGKTQLVTHYVYDAVAQSRYNCVLWLHAEFDLVTQVRRALHWLDASPNVNEQVMNLSTLFENVVALLRKQRSCVVFDNADEGTYLGAFLQFIRHARSIHVIVTSRLIDQSWFPNVSNINQQIKLNDGLSESEVGEFLRQQLAESYVNVGGEETNQVQRLHEMLGGLPLAVAQAAAYLKLPGCTITEYCDQFEQQCLVADGHDKHNYTVARTLTLAIRNLTPQQKSVLAVLAYLAADHITVSQIESIFKINDFDDTLKAAARYSILSYSLQTSKVQIHRLTQQALRWLYAQNGDHEKNYIHVFECILPQLSYDPSKITEIASVAELIPHASVIMRIKHDFLSDEKQLAMWNRIGYHQLDAVANFATAKTCFEEALTITNILNGNNHPSTATNVNNLGLAWGGLGDSAKQIQLLEKALEIQIKYYGNNHPLTAKTMNNCGMAWAYLGDYAKQKQMLEKALEIRVKHYGNNHPSTANTMNSLGNAWGSLGDYAKQKELAEKALEISVKHYGNNHHLTATIMNNLGMAWGSLGDYVKQKELLEKALEIRMRHYGNNHPFTATTMNNLGIAWGNLGDYAKQKELLEKALEIRMRHYGNNHHQTATTMHNLGECFYYLKDSNSAISFERCVYRIRRAFYGVQHELTMISDATLKKYRQKSSCTIWISECP